MFLGDFFFICKVYIKMRVGSYRKWNRIALTYLTFAHLRSRWKADFPHLATMTSWTTPSESSLSKMTITSFVTFALTILENDNRKYEVSRRSHAPLRTRCFCSWTLRCEEFSFFYYWKYLTNPVVIWLFGKFRWVTVLFLTRRNLYSEISLFT